MRKKSPDINPEVSPDNAYPGINGNIGSSSQLEDYITPVPMNDGESNYSEIKEKEYAVESDLQKTADEERIDTHSDEENGGYLEPCRTGDTAMALDPDNDDDDDSEGQLSGIRLESGYIEVTCVFR